MKLSMYDRFVVTCLNLLLSCVIKAINCEAFVEEKEVVSRMPTSADRRLEIMSALDHSRESFDRPLFRRPRPTSVHSDLISSMVVGSTSDEWINDSGPFDVAAKSTGRVTAKDHRVDLLAGSYVSHRHHRHNSTYFIASSKNRSLADFDKNMTYVPLKKHLNLEVPLGLDPATTEEHQITPGLLGIPIRRRALICPFKVVVDTLFYRHVGSESVGRTMKIVAHYMRYMDNYLRNIDVTGDGFPDNIGIYITELVIYRHGPFDTPSVDIWDPRLFFKELRAYNFRRHCGGLVFTYRNMGSDTVISDGPSLIVTNPQKKYGLGICNSDDAKMVDGIKLDYGSYVTNALPLNFRSLNTTASQSSMEVAVIHQLGHLLGASDDYKTGQCNFGNMHTVHASAFPINPGIGGKRSRNLSVCALQSITDYVKYKGRYCLKLCYEAGCRPFVELPPPILIPSPPTVVTLPPRTIPGADHDFLSGQHNWYAASHARPTYCNICREALSGVTSHGLSCEVCKLKAHKRCAAKAVVNCKWTTLASVGRDIIEDEEGNIAMHHQWMEGNLPVSAKCAVCDKTCGSVLRLQDWRCLWCRAMVHTGCRPQYTEKCPLGPCRLSVVPPTALHSIGSDDAWDAVRPIGCSPLLVFVNSKSGDNQGVKFLRRFKQILNPAQVFDLMNGGPNVGLRLFKTFDPFRILVCGGDGSIGWVLSELDKLDMHKQCQLGILPLGTGNDLARVLGWGSACDDDTLLPQLLEKYEKATTKMLDRWSIMTYEGTVPISRKSTRQFEPITAYEDSVVAHLTKILHSDQHSVVISSAKVLCETVRDFVAKVGEAYQCSGSDEEDSIAKKCAVLNDKLNSLLMTLNEEALAINAEHEGLRQVVKADVEREDETDKEEMVKEETFPSSPEKEIQNPEESRASDDDGEDKESKRKDQAIDKSEKEAVNKEMATTKRQKTTFIQREALMSRANSLKKAVRQIIEHAEKAVDEQNAQTIRREGFLSKDPSDVTIRPTFCFTSIDHDSQEEISSAMYMSPKRPTANLQVLPTIESVSSENSPCPSPLPQLVLSPGSTPSPMPFLELPTSEEDKQRSLSPSPDNHAGFSQEPDSEKQDLEGSEKDKSEPTSPVRSRSGTDTMHSPLASRRISSGSTLKHAAAVAGRISTLAVPAPGPVPREKSRSPDLVPKRELPIISPLSSLPFWPNIAGGSLISKVLLANADALCAAASPLMDTEDGSLEGYEEKCVMNNYFGIGLDAKITLDFHNKREEHPEKCRSRTKNFMWYGVLGGKEFLQKNYKNLEQKVLLECDGQRIPLPSLQGIVVLNIPSYAGGTNFWGGTKEDDIFFAPSFDDKILEVVAVFGSVQMAASRIIKTQHHRISQCRLVKITIIGDEGVPVQVDGEAWVQPPGIIRIVHKNRSQMLCRNRQLETTLRAWEEKQRSTSGSTSKQSVSQVPQFTEEEALLLMSFAEAASNLIQSVRLACSSYPVVEKELFPLVSQISAHTEQLFAGGSVMDIPNGRLQVTDYVTSIRQLYLETSRFLQEGGHENLHGDEEDKINVALANMDMELRKCTDVNSLVHFHAVEDEQFQEKKRKGLFKLMFKKPDKGREAKMASPGATGIDMPVNLWSIEEVMQWLDTIQMGEYKDNFVVHDIRGAELLHLERRDFKDLGISKVGHIKRILQAIKDISSLQASRSSGIQHQPT